ncbi:hypothetical protein Lser_V15G14522 [Lactuca serriola]
MAFSLSGSHPSSHCQLTGLKRYIIMQHDDSHINSINLSSSIGSTTRIPILFPNEYEVWALHFKDYVLGLEDNGYLIWEAITLGAFVHTGTKRVIKTQSDYNKLFLDVKDVPRDEKDKLISNVKAMGIIRFALPVDTFCLFGAFTQKPEESLSQNFNRYNHLLSRMRKHNIGREVIKQKVTFMNGLRSEWIEVVSTVKAHEQFKNYTLAKLVGILKSHENEVTKEEKFVSGIGSLAHIAKGKKVADDG